MNLIDIKVALNLNIIRKSILSMFELVDVGKKYSIKNKIHYINDNYMNVTIDKYVIMPNHIHLIVNLDNSGASASTRTRPCVPQVSSPASTKCATWIFRPKQA